MSIGLNKPLDLVFQKLCCDLHSFGFYSSQDDPSLFILFTSTFITFILCWKDCNWKFQFWNLSIYLTAPFKIYNKDLWAFTLGYWGSSCGLILSQAKTFFIFIKKLIWLILTTPVLLLLNYSWRFSICYYHLTWPIVLCYKVCQFMYSPQELIGNM